MYWGEIVTIIYNNGGDASIIVGHGIYIWSFGLFLLMFEGVFFWKVFPLTTVCVFFADDAV